MAAQPLQIHRLTNGTIDIDYYRNQARIERMRAFHKLSGSMSGIVGVAWPVVVAALILVVATTVSHGPAAKDVVTNGAAITASLGTR